MKKNLLPSTACHEVPRYLSDITRRKLGIYYMIGFVYKLISQSVCHYVKNSGRIQKKTMINLINIILSLNLLGFLVNYS